MTARQRTGLAGTTVDTTPNARYEVSVFRELSTVDDVLRRNLIEALKSRSWTYHAAERAASFVARLYQEGESEWKVWPSEARGPDHYRVARSANAPSVYDSPVDGQARDVADALTEIERHGSDATGIP